VLKPLPFADSAHRARDEQPPVKYGPISPPMLREWSGAAAPRSRRSARSSNKP
jgi:hypothetical protein